ncbi:MAG: acyltransferase [Rhodobacteraceae bacterium]|nr:acyltransferase [Paracoccaceae bacterium]
MAGLEHRKDIDGLRMLAVLPVVAHHAGVAGFEGGFVGVDIFFVISGYLIAGILLAEIAEGTFSLLGFYERRVRRILPALIAVVAVALAAGYLMFPPGLLNGLAKSAVATLGFASNIWFYVTTSDYFAPAAETEMLLHTWSLAVEEQFYILFPVLLWCLMSHGRPAMFVIAALTGLSFAWSALASGAYPSASFYLPPTRVWELGLGVLLAMQGATGRIGRRVPAAAAELAAIAGLAAIALAVTRFSEATVFPGAAAALPCLGAVMIIWAGAQHPTLVTRCLSLSGPVFIGLVSYSLYLWHWPVLVLLRLRLGVMDLPAPAVALAIGLSLVLATLSWRFVERPFRIRPARAEERPAARRRVFVQAATGVALLFLAAAVIVAGDGLPGRIPETAARIFAVADDPLPNPLTCTDAEPTDGLCDIGAAGVAPTVLLWGDSHAGALANGLDLALTEAGLAGALAYREGCPPILGVKRIDHDRGTACSGFNDSVIATLRKEGGYGTVILYARWALSVEGREDLSRAAPPAYLRKVGQEDTAGGQAANFAVFEETFAPTVKAILATGRQVIIVKGTPEFPFRLPAALGNRQMYGAPPPVGLDADEAHRRNTRVNAVIDTVANLPGVTKVDPVAFLCEPDCLMTLADGTPLYRDSDHFGIAGAAYLSRALLIPLLRD